MKKTAILTAGVFFAVSSAFALGSDYYWGDVSGVFDGVFSDGAHWHKSSQTGATGTVPSTTTSGSDTALFFCTNDYTVTFPYGAYTNVARFYPAVSPGNTITIDGLNSVYLHGENAYSSGGNPIAVRYFKMNGSSRVGPYDAVSTEFASSSPNPYTSPQLEFSNFKFHATSTAERSINVVFESGIYDFLHPAGKIWDKNTQKPIVYFSSLGHNGGNPDNDFMDLIDVEFKAGASLRAAAVGFQGNAYENRVTFRGGEQILASVFMPGRIDGGRIAERRTTTEVTFTDGAQVSMTNGLWFGDNKYASNRFERVVVGNGSRLQIAGMCANYGDHELIADGGTVVFGDQGRTDQGMDAASELLTSFAMIGRNGGKFIFDHKGQAASSNGHGMYFGAKTEAVTAPHHFVRMSDSSVELLSGGKWNIYGAYLEFNNSSLLLNTGSAFSLIGCKLFESQLRFGGDSVFTNNYEIYVGSSYPFRMVVTNEAQIVLNAALHLGGYTGNDANYGYLDIAGGTIEIVSPSGYINCGHQVKSSGTINMYGGTVIDRRYQASTFDIGSQGHGEFNMYGGYLEVFRPRLAMDSNNSTTYDSYYASLPEAVFRLYGGEIYATCKGNGSHVGFAVGGDDTYGSTKRRARLVLNGGILTSYTTYGGRSSVCKGGTGWTVCEADGGTLRIPAYSPVTISQFDEVIVGPKGLTFDSNGFTMNIAQHVFANKPDEEGRIVFAGEGTKCPTGNVAQVSNIVLAGGLTDLSQLDQSTVQNLIITNGAAVLLNPSRPLKVTGSAEFGEMKIRFSSTPSKGDTFSVMELGQPLDPLSLQQWEDSLLDSPLADGTFCQFSQTYDSASGKYLLKADIKERQTLYIYLGKNQTSNGVADVSYVISDLLVVDTDTNAYLTLSGALAKGGLLKQGAGALKLANTDNNFASGLTLNDGMITVADLAPVRIGANAKAQAKHGVFEVTGPESGAMYDHAFEMIQKSTNDIFIVKNDVDLEMPCLAVDGQVNKGTTGEFVKRGPGTLTLTVSGTKQLCGGCGKAKINNNAWGWAIEGIEQLQYDKVSGQITTAGVPPFLVAEGELYLKGKGDNAKAIVNGYCTVGTSTQVGTVQPGLVLDNVYFTQNQYPYTWFQLGAGINYNVGAAARSNDFAKASYVILTNNATLHTAQFEIGRFACGSDVHPRLEVDHSTFNPYNYFSINRAQESTVVPTIEFRNNSQCFLRAFYLNWDATLNFDSTLIANNESGKYAPVTIKPETVPSTGATAIFNFRNGSVLYCNQLNPSNLNLARWHPLTLNFWDSTWYLDSDTIECTLTAPTDGRVKVYTYDRLTMPVAADCTWSIELPIEGEGGVVKTGAGTLKFVGNALAFSGNLTIDEGAVDLSDHESITDLQVAGAGTLRSPTADSITLHEEFTNEVYSAVIACPTLEDIQSTSITVDFGRTSFSPLPIEQIQNLVVGYYTGIAPSIAKWKVTGTGIDRVKGEFVCQDGKVILKSLSTGYGSLIITR